MANLAISMLPGVGLIHCGTKVAKGAFIAWEVVSAVGDVATAGKHAMEGNFGWSDALSIAGAALSIKGIGSIQCFTADMHLTEDMVDRQFVIPPAPLAKIDPDEQVNDAWIALGVGMLFTTSLQFRRRRQRRISNMSAAPLISTDDSLERESPTERPDAAALDEAFCGVLQLESKPAARDSQPNTCQTRAVSQELASHAVEVTSSRARVPRLCEPCLPSPRSSRFFELRRWLFLLVGLLFSGFCFQQSGLLQSGGLSLPSAGATTSETDPTRVPPAVPVLASDTVTSDTPSYKTKSVAAFQPGDAILAYNTSTKKLEQRKVKNAFRKTADHLRLLTLRDESGREQTIKTTNEHPFYRVWKNLPDAGEWIEAEDLRAGDKLRSADGELVTLIATEYESHPQGVAVYNVEVEDLHSYFVSAHGSRAPPVLSHNQECRVSNIVENAASGRAREARVQSKLQGAFPNASIQRERYLRTADGKIARDEFGNARRIDHAVIENGKVRHLVETTSKTADKGMQVSKEASIRMNGGTFIRDKFTRELLDVSDVITTLFRVK